MSPFPSSTYQAADFWARVMGVGIPVPSATMNISSGPTFSVRGYQASGLSSAKADDDATATIRNTIAESTIFIR